MYQLPTALFPPVANNFGLRHDRVKRADDADDTQPDTKRV